MVALVGFGIVLRVAQYAFNRSLWLDELLLAENLIDRSIPQLLEPLSYNQGAPIGFLVLSKLVAASFGYGELALRAIPLLSGIFSVALVALLAYRITDYRTAVIAVMCFATIDQLIYYSSEFKQYSSDVVATAAILLLCTYFRRNYGLRQTIAGSVIGLIAILCSHPSVFILAGAGITLLISFIKSKQWRSLGWLLITVTLWLCAFFAYYQLMLKNLDQNQYLLDFWQQGLLTQPAISIYTPQWIVDRLVTFFSDPLGIYPPLLGVFLAGVGAYRMSRRNPGDAALLILPVAATLIAACLRKYPFSGRLVLFLAPIAVLLVSSGVSTIVEIGHRYVWKGLGLVALAALLFQPFYISTYHLLQPRSKQETRPVIEYVAEHKQENDAIYLYYPSTHAYNYYSRLIGLNVTPIVGVKSRENTNLYLADLDQLRGRGRVWLIFSRVYSGSGVNEETLFVTYLNKIAILRDSYRSNGASTYLYDFGR